MHRTLPPRRLPAKTTAPFQFRAGENPADGCHRILGELAAEAHDLDARISARHASAEAVHDCRTLIKRLRSLAWFAKPALPKTTAELAKKHLRDAAHLLAAQRDSAVLKTVFQSLAQQAGKKRARKAVLTTAQSLRPADGPTDSPGKSLLQALGEIRQAITALDACSTSGASWATPQKRVHKAVRTVKSAREKAFRDRKDVDFHAWRKKAKRLMHEITLGQATIPHADKALKRADRLQQMLGDRHDLVLVQEHLRKAAHPAPDDAARIARVLTLIEKKKKRLDKKAKKIVVR